MPRSRFLWNAQASRYIGPDGQFVTQKAIRRELDRALTQADTRSRALADAIQANAITLEQFRQGMREVIAQVHLYSAAAARGGWGQMTQRAYGQVGGMVKSEFRYLENFVGQIRDGLPLDGHFLQRATLYTQAGRETYHRAERDVMRAQGQNQERNVEDRAAEHCEGANSCPGETLRGWVALGKLIPIGARVCGRRCRCRIRYGNAASPDAPTPDSEVERPAPPSFYQQMTDAELRQWAQERGKWALTRAGQVEKQGVEGFRARVKAALKGETAITTEKVILPPRIVPPKVEPPKVEAPPVITPPVAPPAIVTPPRTPGAVKERKIRRVHGKGTSLAFRADMDAVIDQLPPGIRDRIAKRTKIVTGPLLTDALPTLSGQPRGWAPGAVWDNVGGVHASGSNHAPRGRSVVAVSEFTRPTWSGPSGEPRPQEKQWVKGTMAHELGHALDHTKGGQIGYFSRLARFKRAYEQDVRASGLSQRDNPSIQYFLQPGEAGPSEAFAELFAEKRGFVRKQEYRGKALSEYFPRFSKMMDELIAEIG